MRLAFAFAFALALSACGGPTGSHTIHVGDCAPAPASAQLVMAQRNFSYGCDTTGVFTVDAQPALDQLVARCSSGSNLRAEIGTVDFTTHRLLVIGGNNGQGNPFVSYIAASPAQLDVGILYQPAGFAAPPTVLLLPNAGGPLAVHACHAECVGYCPPIP